MQVVVSTVGTSILTNGCSSELRELLTATANDTEEELIRAGTLQSVQETLDERRRALSELSIEETRRQSAELNGLAALGVLNSQNSPQGVMNYLVHTDTYQGEQVASLLAEWIEAQTGNPCQLVKPPGLSTKNFLNFQAAMAELARWASQEIQPYRQKDWKVTFNLTGGFKSVNGFLQALGAFYADEVVYLFESSRELLRIPRLPLELAPINTFRENLDLFRRLSAYQELDHEECKDLPQTLIETDGKSASLSVWGEILWKQFKESTYQESLCPPISDKVKFGQAFEKEANQLPPDRRRILNERIDDLCLHLCDDSKPAPSSLSFKKLGGNPVAGSTHEFYAWSDKDARRVFGHFEDRTFIVDRLGKHL